MYFSPKIPSAYKCPHAAKCIHSFSNQPFPSLFFHSRLHIFHSQGNGSSFFPSDRCNFFPHIPYRARRCDFCLKISGSGPSGARLVVLQRSKIQSKECLVGV